MAALCVQYPGIGLEDQGARVRVTIPDTYRVGHEAHFAQVTRQFFEYLESPERFPAWENPNMLAKILRVSTQGVELQPGELKISPGRDQQGGGNNCRCRPELGFRHDERHLYMRKRGIDGDGEV